MEAVQDKDQQEDQEDQLELFEGHSVTKYEAAFGNLAQVQLEERLEIDEIVSVSFKARVTKVTNHKTGGSIKRIHALVPDGEVSLG